MGTGAHTQWCLDKCQDRQPSQAQQEQDGLETEHAQDNKDSQVCNKEMTTCAAPENTTNRKKTHISHITKELEKMVEMQVRKI